MGIPDLLDSLIVETLKQKYMGELVPKVYLDLEDKLVKMKTKQKTLPWKNVKKLGSEVGIYDEKDLKAAVNFLHDLGSIQYFDREILRDILVTDPQWIVDVMACIVSVKDSPVIDGRLNHSDIKIVWKDFPAELHSWLLKF